MVESDHLTSWLLGWLFRKRVKRVLIGCYKYKQKRGGSWRQLRPQAFAEEEEEEEEGEAVAMVSVPPVIYASQWAAPALALPPPYPLPPPPPQRWSDNTIILYQF